MFIVFRPDAFRMVYGFDSKRFYMYLEDVDICERLWGNGWSVMLNPKVSVTHYAQRSSHKKLKYMRLHIISTIRYFFGL
jgi:GT2 family glycosyltransferase